MTSISSRRSRYRLAAIALLTATLVPGLTQLPALADDATPAPAPAPLKPATGKVPDLSTTFRGIGDPVAGKPDVDTRGRALPSPAQQRAVARLGAVEMRWNAFGTPASILPADGVLARATSQDPVVAARAWLSDNADVFGISRAQVAGMQAIDQKLVGTDGHAVFFRQTFGGLLPAIGSAVTVAVSDGEIVYVSSSITKTTQQIPAARISPAAGWLKAAADVGVAVPADLSTLTRSVSGGWTRLTVPGLVQEQLVRVRALANADGSVRPVLEANVIDVQGGKTLGYTVLVDAVDGRILHRENKVENAADAAGPSTLTGMPQGVVVAPRSNGTFPFSGSITASACGPKHAFNITNGATTTITAVAAMVNSADDITINLYDPSGVVVASQDLATSPEVLTYTPGTPIPAGSWKAEVCPFDGAATLPPFNYALTVNTTDQGAPSLANSYNPKWRFFTANPTLDSSTQTPRNAVVGCWLQVAGCTLPTGQLKNIQAFAPWDVLSPSGVSSNTTVGNNANSHEAWVSPLTPGGLFQAPVSATGDYRQTFTDAWNNSRCNPAELVPGGNDINFSVANLFVVHNRMHDWSYYLGFTEANYNLQTDNGGRGGVGADAEIGNVQAGALGGLQTGLGRDNANQIAMQDGVAGITNQYLFQPIAGAFYSPCTDGGLDMGIVGHEYTHAISNRMVGGPDEGLTSEQGGAMGESWSDQDAAEYQFAHGYSNGGNVWAVGAYATGNKTVAIRDYAINHNPLNYSNYGFDTTGPEVHADGEIWNGTQWEVRQALVKKYDKQFPYRNKALQLRCAEGRADASPLAADKCPGNRRWIQLVFDSFLLQQGATTMLDARDGMIAADKIRFKGADTKLLWDAFARRGMGVGAHAKDGEDIRPVPSFKSIGGAKGNTKVVFKMKPGASVFVGDYMARSRSIADNTPKTKTKSNVAFFTPGRYDMLLTSFRHGFMRFHMTVKKGQKVQVVRIRTSKNYASAPSGAKIIRATGGSRRPGQLIDGTENYGWGVATSANVDVSHPSVDIDLAGKKPVVIKTVAVSALLRPKYREDQDAGSRFTALRKFAVEACVKACASPKARWKRVYVSPSNAFPASRPRPVAPTLNMRAFAIKPTRAAALRLVVLENQCTGFAGYAGELDSDPANTTDCKAGSDRGTIAHVAEFQAFTTSFPSWKSSYGIDNPQRSFR
ncbi:M36 family metallopeptidase [Nocardioides rubriscoriae]|uniref:M36 family metallopeptidase n=1 Tax=Nocardioides rubriscoriae TaxID=642762 RepID=UPI0011E06D19|nr:M36 family metallopeptidase [Nocardioides rubriscoriae]